MPTVIAAHEALWWWVPAGAVLALALLGLLAARGRVPGARRTAWVFCLILVGAAAVWLTIWQHIATRDLLRQETARLQEAASRLADLGKLLSQAPGADTVGNPAATFDTVSDAVRSLNTRIEDLQEQIRAARETYRNRRIEPETASRLSAYLREAGPHRAVVSAVPGDAEAFTYANQLVNILRDAGWEALGPETTTIFGTSAYPGVTLFAPSGGASPAVNALIEAFTRFNIPYRSGIPAREAIPDPGTVFLFVSGKS